MLKWLRRKIFGASACETLLESLMEAEIHEDLTARKAELAGPPAVKEGGPEWVRTPTLDDELIPAEDMRRFKRRRAILNFGDGKATESDLACLTRDELDRLEAIEVQVRWDRFLGGPKGLDVKPGRYFP